MKAFRKLKSNGYLKQGPRSSHKHCALSNTLEMIKAVAKPKSEAYIPSDSSEIAVIYGIEEHSCGGIPIISCKVVTILDHQHPPV